MHRRRAKQRLVRRREVLRMQDEGARLRAAEPAVEADQLLERAALVERRVIEAADHDVRDVLEAVRAQQVADGGRGEVRERVLALHARSLEMAGAARTEL